MKTSVRNQLFESNSSSSHAVAVAKGDVFDRFFDQQAIRSGKVHLRNITDLCDRDEWMRLYLPENILSFLIVSEIEDCVGKEMESFRNDVQLLMPEVTNQPFNILPVIRANFPAVESGLSFLEREYKLDFEMLVLTGQRLRFDTNNLAAAVGYFDDVSGLKRLLFNSESYVELTPENGWGLPPREIATDRGDPYVVANYEELLKRFDDNLNSFNKMLVEIAEKREKADDE